MSEEIKNTEVKEGELTTANYEIVGFDETQIPKGRIGELKKVFVPMLESFNTHQENKIDIMSEFDKYKDTGKMVPPELVARAKRHRIDIGKMWTAAENARKLCNIDLNLAKKGNDLLASFVKDLIADDKNEVKAIENHNESLRIKQEKADREEKEALGKERLEELKQYSEYCKIDESTDFAAMAPSIFEHVKKGLKEEFEECKKEAERVIEEERIALEKQKLHRARKDVAYKLSNYIPDFDNVEFGEIEPEAFDRIIEFAGIQKEKDEAEQKRIAEENKRLKEERDIEEVRQAKLKADQDEKDRTAKEAQDKKDREVARDKLKKENEFNAIAKAKIKADKEAEDARLETARILREAKEKEAKRLEEIETARKEKELAEKKLAEALKQLSEGSTEITAGEIERAKHEGKAVYVTLKQIVLDAEKPGVFIVKAEK